MEITGTVKVKNSKVQVSEKFKKREFVIVDNSSQYPQFIQFQLTQDRCSLLDGVKEGDEIKVSFNIQGREWKNPQGEIKYFNSLTAWRLEIISASNAQNSAPAALSPQSNTSAPIDDFASANPNNDDLPF